MKKMMMTLAAVLCCTMTTTVFTACSSDDDNTPNQPENSQLYVEMTFTYWGTQDLLDIADMTVTYNDGTGDKTETVTTVDWVKTVKATLPVSFKVERKVTLKEGVKLSEDKTYSYLNKFVYKCRVMTAKGEIIRWDSSEGSGKPNPLNVKGSEVNNAITSGHMNISRAFDFDKEGKCPQINFPE